MIHRVLHIPEILSLVFKFSDNSVLRNAALVCKNWMDPALDQLWRSVTASALFQLLAPMRLIGTHPDEPLWIFSSYIPPSAWSRFNFYANRVRELAIEDDNHRLDHSLFTEFSRARPRTILPRLQRLISSTSCLIHTTTFMHSGVKSLSIKLDGPFLAGEGFKEAKAYLVEVSARLPHLTSLDINALFSVVRVERELIELLRGLSSLEKLVLPRYWITNSILTAIEKLPGLRVIGWEYGSNGEGDVEDITNLKYIPSQDSFPSLVDFNIEADISPVMEILGVPSFASHLDMIYVRSLNQVSPSELHDLLVVCRMNCSSLSQLRLELFPNEPPVGESSSENITIETLSPVLSYKNLTHFSLQYVYAVSLTDDDIESIARGCPALIHFYLAKDYWSPGDTRLTLRALIPLAKYCHYLEELGLCLDANVIPEISDLTPSFKRIRSIDFGNSPIDSNKVDKIALFLSYVCVRETVDPCLCTVAISSRVGWDQIYLRVLEYSHDGLLERSQHWSDVNQRLGMLLALRVEERMRTRRLEAELEKLRAEQRQQRHWSPSTQTQPSTMPFEHVNTSNQPHPTGPQNQRIPRNSPHIDDMSSLTLPTLEEILGTMTRTKELVVELGVGLKMLREMVLGPQYDFEYTPITLGESASQVSSLPRSKSNILTSTFTPTFTSSESSPFATLPEQPSSRPSEYPKEVLWTLSDAWDDSVAKVSPDNKYRPSMRKCIRNTDGTLVDDSQWRSIRRSMNVVYRSHLRPFANPESPIFSDKFRTKRFYLENHEDAWNKAIFALEAREPLLRLCAHHWKAEHTLARKVESTRRTQAGKKKYKVDEDTPSEDEENEECVDVKGKRPADPSETSSRARRKEKTSHELEKSAEQSISHLSPKPQQFQQLSLMSSSEDIDDSPSTSPMCSQAVFEGNGVGGENTTTKDVGTIKPVVPHYDTFIQSNFIDCSFIIVEPTYEALHRAFTPNTDQFASSDMARFPDLLDALRALPNHGIEPSPALQEFLTAIETADPNAPDVDEDNTNASWGHGHFRRGSMGINNLSWPATWADIGTCEIAYRVLAATIRTCRVSRHLCFKRKISASTFLADIYLSKIVERLWEHVRLQQGNIASSSQNVATPSFDSPAGASERSQLQSLLVNELKALVQTHSVKIDTARKIPVKEDYVNALLSLSPPISAIEIENLVRERKEKVKGSIKVLRSVKPK